jgi:nitroreductase
MNVSEAVDKRMSVRKFRPDPVSDETLRSLLADASRAPSGGNLQPWRVYVVNGESMTRLREFLPTQPPMDAPEYDMYPKRMSEPYKSNVFRVGEMMYATIGVAREDKEARRAQFGQNNDFFGAPASIFMFLDRQMNQPQWSDAGMFLQTFMLLAVERGLGTCPQEYWSIRHKAVSTFVGAPENEMLFCGVAIGHVDESAPINTLRSERMPLEQWTTFV